MNRLQEIRKDRDLNQTDIAKAIGKSQTSISEYEIETHGIPTVVLKRLASYYNTSIDYLLYRTDIRKPYSQNTKGKNRKINRLKMLRKEKSLSQEDISNILNVDQSTYSRYENNKHDIPIDILHSVANYYNTSTDYILCYTNDRTPYKKSIMYEIE